MTSTPAISRADVGLRSERGPILLAVMLSIGLVAIDSTILATAVPAVVDDLGGFTQFPWLFSVYLLAQAVSVPLYSKLADQYGRKPMMMIGVGCSCRLAAVRARVGHGQPHRVPRRSGARCGRGDADRHDHRRRHLLVAERAKVQGYLASVWALAAVVGPTLGGVFADYLSWRWIFFVNLPIGAAAMFMLLRRFHEHVTRERHRFDLLGALLLTGGGVSLLLALLEGGVQWAWGSAVSVALFAVVGGAAGRLRVRRDAGRRAGAPALGVPAPRDPACHPGVAGDRRPADGADVVHPALRAGRARPRRGELRASRLPR